MTEQDHENSKRLNDFPNRYLGPERRSVPRNGPGDIDKHLRKPVAGVITNEKPSANPWPQNYGNGEGQFADNEADVNPCGEVSIGNGKLESATAFPPFNGIPKPKVMFPMGDDDDPDFAEDLENSLNYLRGKPVQGESDPRLVPPSGGSVSELARKEEERNESIGNNLDAGGGLRMNSGKIRMELTPPEWDYALADVTTQGSKKYAARNWELGMEWSVMVGCMKRHLVKFEAGERYDGKEFDIAAGTTGCHHLAMVAWNALALMSYDLRQIGENDLPDAVTVDLLKRVNAMTSDLGVTDSDKSD